MKMYFVSDTHFHHKNIIRFANRPFSSVDEMNSAMISNWNNVVAPNSIVYHLGDFAYGTWNGGSIEDVFHKLNGQKILIRGNHDHEPTLALPWLNIYDYKEIKYNGIKIILSHYPLTEWNGAFHGSLHFHGHTHVDSPLEILKEQARANPYKNNWLNLSIEHIDYTPQHIDNLLLKIKEKNS